MSGQSKPGPSSGISLTEFQVLRTRVQKLEEQLGEVLSEKNMWNSAVRKWQDERTKVQIKVSTGDAVRGWILWVDRYTIGMSEDAGSTNPIIVHKGRIVTIQAD